MGYIRINRRLFDHQFWKENRIYSRAEAWIDLIQLASFANNNKAIIDGVSITWNRGEYPISHKFLSLRWNWSTHKVRIFMSGMRSEQQVAMRTTGRTTILILCNYDYYNPISQGDVQSGVQGQGKVRAQIKEDKEDNTRILKEINNKEKGKTIIDPKKEEEVNTWNESLLKDERY
jgi:hypothetical protein